MSNIHEGKFKAFANTLGAKNAQHHHAATAAHSGEVFRDKPFSEEYRTLYNVAKAGQAFAQVVTFCTTAALGVFALTHIIPLWFGIYLAVPLGIAFAFGVEKVKRSTLAIASKHLLKYKTFGFVGLVALLTLCVSIAAALYGAKELPGVVYPPPARAADPASAVALTAEIDRVQGDINRLQTGLKSGKNWTAENRTLPRLQKERAALVERRDAASQAAEGRADAQHSEAQQERAEKVEKMQTYSVGAAIVAELVFLLCTAFILYFLFRLFAEQQAAHETNATTVATHNAPPIQPERNGSPVSQNLRTETDIATQTVRADGKRATERSTDFKTLLPGQRICEHCQNVYTYGHARQRFCAEKCRIENWQDHNGKQIRHRINVKA